MSTEKKEEKLSPLAQLKQEKEAQLRQAMQALEQMGAQHKRLGEQIQATRGMVEEMNRSIKRMEELEHGQDQEKPAKAAKGTPGAGAAAERGPKLAE